VFADESEKRHKLRELFTMKNIISTLIAQEVPRLDANPPPPPWSKSSAASKSVPAYTKTTARNESEDDSDTFEDAPGTDEISPMADKPSAVKKRRSTKRCNDVRNWQAGKVRNCTPERINDDI
jgi:hypothetical protein